MVRTGRWWTVLSAWRAWFRQHLCWPPLFAKFVNSVKEVLSAPSAISVCSALCTQSTNTLILIPQNSSPVPEPFNWKTLNRQCSQIPSVQVFFTSTVKARMKVSAFFSRCLENHWEKHEVIISQSLRLIRTHCGLCPFSAYSQVLGTRWGWAPFFFVFKQLFACSCSSLCSCSLQLMSIQSLIYTVPFWIYLRGLNVRGS